MKHELERLGPEGFEQLVQALMSKLFGVRVKIYGDGPDRQREAVIENAHYTICGEVEALGRTIVQAKFKSPEGSAEDWSWLRTNLKKELDGFKKKRGTEPGFLPDTWLFFTNITLTPGEGGLKDRAEAYVKENYSGLIPHIHLLGADELRALLDANPEIARRYAAFLTPGDVLSDTLDYLEKLRLKPLNSMMEYVCERFQSDEPVKLEQAGSSADRSIDVRHVYTDLEASERGGEKRLDGLAAAILRLGDSPHPREVPESPEPRAAPPKNNLVLIGSAGQGKSTLCQYVCQLYRAALLERYRPHVEDARAYSAEAGIPKPKCERFPLLIRLKDYAAWLAQRTQAEKNGSVLHYLLKLIEDEAETRLSTAELRELLSGYSWIFFFDGLDEVPASSNRAEVLRQIDVFLSRELTQARCDSLVVCTSRPQGYDEAFSPRLYRHFELLDMSRELCLRYVDRLLEFLEPDRQERRRYRAILEQAQTEALVAKLMVTPLYTAILVLLVKSGVTPPTMRFELFEKYCETVKLREQQRGLLPSLYAGDDGVAWVDELHGQIAYLLQSESEKAENAAAELSLPRCRALIRAYLEEECWAGDREEMTDSLLRAMTERLPFLSATTDANNESCVLFPLRSIQEYYAARRLLRIEDAEARYEMLRALSLSAYWRNVFLFVAGAYSKNDSRSVNNDIYEICGSNNGDARFEGREPLACALALSGSRLALDLLCDNLFQRRGGQERYLALAAELLKWDYTGGSPVDCFLKLPPALLERFIRDWAIPRLREAGNPNEAAFALLCAAAKRGNAEALDCLEETADALSVPTRGTVTALLNSDVEGLGQKLMRRVLAWLTEEYPRYYIRRPYFDKIALLFQRTWGKERKEDAPTAARRHLAYSDLYVFYRYRHSSYRISFDFMRDSFLRILHELTEHIPSTKLHLIGYAFQGCSCSVLWSEAAAAAWAPVEALCLEYSMEELAALAAFLREPSDGRLAALLEAAERLPKGVYQAFLAVMREQNWLLRRIAVALEAGDSPAALARRYDAATLERCRERESAIASALKSGDLTALSAMNAWKDMEYIDFDPTEEEAAAFLESISDDGIERLNSVCPSNSLHVAFRAALLRRFPALFQRWAGVDYALQAFAETPPDALAADRPTFPSALPKTAARFLEQKTCSDILERIETLARIGGAYTEVYALLPYVIPQVEAKPLRRLVRTAAPQYEAVKATGNDCALLGVILLLLMDDEIPATLKDALRGDLERLLARLDPSLWNRLSQHLSLNGKLLAHEAGLAAYRGTEQEPRFLRRSRCAILQSLEALPAERDKLPAPGAFSLV